MSEPALEGEIVECTPEQPLDVKDYYNFTVKRPRWHYEVVGKKTLLGKLGLASPPVNGWDIVGFRKFYDDEEPA